MRHSALASLSSTTWPSQMQTQIMSPKSSTRSFPWMMTRCSSTIWTTISPTSRKPRTRTQANSVFTQCLDPLFCTFLMMILLFRWKAKKACNGEIVARQREIEEREGFVISAAESMSKKSRRNSISKILKRHRKSCPRESQKIYLDGWDLREHLQRSARQPIIAENSDQRRLYLNEHIIIARNWNEEIQIFHYSSRKREPGSQRLQLLEDIHWTDQVECILSRWSWNYEYICVANWRWRIMFIKKLKN